ncbi:UDP-N-acetylmuramate dehydrogenase [Vibrio sp. ZSDZ34]|uniref:UDP-N-acetylenolpyruvoylglucosamine reductase n=1 Tax=Vibrio gelatinilyticus TaxID=2893468 RepID=A0A9X2AXV4_9VIBR|nr:UDP-N-acetylmuramate dehydrogenase [Vibrio gelatinilyticus]MCJ2378851.1 UDP-N-acetylmuramate dehydrogenase [Vibrio gelatinilyticus]
MQIEYNAQLSKYHTFSIQQTCEVLVIVESIDDLKEVYQSEKWQSLPKLMLGKGSNMLFTEHFEGVVIINRICGITIVKNPDATLLHVCGGEDWPSLVQWCVDQDLGGIENLALIPGCAGSAPIQNIGAYGLELRDVCQYVEYLCLEELTIKTLSNEQCQFGYRDSIFKHALKNKAVVTAIGLSLPLNWQAKLSYGPLKSLEDPTPRDVFDVVVNVRQQKLPDPAVIGNAGSFFKNPVVSQAQYQQLVTHFPELVAYPAGEGMKLAAGWLIDQCGLKGHSIGGAQVHPMQALVIVNKSNASAQDVVELAQYITQQVQRRFAVELEHEVRFMGNTAEVFLKDFV